MKNVKETTMKKTARCLEVFSAAIAKGAVGRSLMPLGYEVEEPKELIPNKTK